MAKREVSIDRKALLKTPHPSSCVALACKWATQAAGHGPLFKPPGMV